MAGRARHILTSFNGGELSPLMDGRVDQDKYFTGCRTLSNYITTPQGPARRRGGTRRVGEVKDSSARTWFSNFVFSPTQAYILEWGNTYLRFWANRGQLLSLGVPYEIVTPYETADLITAEGTFALRMQQSDDIVWITHIEGKYPVYRLSRFGATSWTLVPEVFTDGPFRDVNTDSSKTVYSSAAGSVGASVTITASSPIFVAGHIGSLFRLSTFNPSTITPYQPSKNVTAGDRVRNAGNVYQAQNSYTYPAGGSLTQRYVPTHTEGDAFDGEVTWRYLHSGYGWGKITAIGGGGTTATLLVSNYIPEECTGAGNATRRWQFSEFSSVYGWPTNVGFFKERLVYLRGKQIFLSRVAGFTSFDRLDAGVITSETAMVLYLSSVNTLRWLAPAKDLLLGSSSGESAMNGQTQQQVFSAGNNVNTPQSQYGSRLLRHLQVADDILFVERAGHRVRDLRYMFQIDKYNAEDISVLSEHLFDGSEREGAPDQGQRDIVDWAYQQQRDSIVWCVCSDGSLAALVLNRDRSVLAWAPHYLGGDGIVEAVQTIPSPDTKTDDAWFIVSRQVNGATVRTVEYMTDYRLVKKGAAEAFHVDGGMTYRGVATSTITGLTWLAGKTVQVLNNGSKEADKVVSLAGVLTLDNPAVLNQPVHVGYKYASKLQTMRPEMQGGGGTSQTAEKSFGDLYFRFQSTIGGKFGPKFESADDPTYTMDRLPIMEYDRLMGEAPRLFNGDAKVSWPAGFTRDNYICYMQDDPYPATCVAIVGRLTVND
jgi:hypothetical protein